MIAQRSAPLVLAKDTFDYNMRYTVYFYQVAHTQATLQPKAQSPLPRYGLRRLPQTIQPTRHECTKDALTKTS